MLRRIPVFCRAGLGVLLVAALGAHAAAPDAPPYPNTSGFGVSFDSGEDWHQQCMRVVRLAPSAAYAGTPSLEEPYTEATDLYYAKRDQAKTTLAEWRRVRERALAAGDDAVLMMLHANGYGLARDTGRAIYHACRLPTAKAEMEARIGYLASGAAAHDSQPFDLCDHITSGRMGATCAAIGERREERTRSARLDRFGAALPPRARAPFARLRQAAGLFARQSADEVDRSGTASAGFATRHARRRADEFTATLLDAAGGKTLRAGAAQLAALERELDAQYRRVLAMPSTDADHPERIGWSTVTRADLQATQRLWLAYRDAWEPYLAAAPGASDPVSVRAQLTRQRIAQLKKF